MSSSNRTDVLKRLYAELKKKYSAILPVERTVLEHFLYAACLEDATYEAADAAFAALVDTMSGWNEVRVSSVAELAELMPQLPDPRGTAGKIRKILHAVFEERYSFDIDDIRKKNLKEAYEKLESIPGGTPFSINYTAQAALGRHGIPVGNGEKRLLYVLGIISEKDIEEREVTGLNRAIAKTQGLEFASLIHQLAAAFVVNPEARKIISFLKAFAPDFRERMPKRREVRIEDSMETPEPVVTHETARPNMMELLINDPDFRKEQKEEKYEDAYEDTEERAKEEYLEEIARNRKKSRSRKGDSGTYEPLFDEEKILASKKAKKSAAKSAMDENLVIDFEDDFVEESKTSEKAKGKTKGKGKAKAAAEKNTKSEKAVTSEKAVKKSAGKTSAKAKEEKAQAEVPASKTRKTDKTAKADQAPKTEKNGKTAKAAKAGKESPVKKVSKSGKSSKKA